MLLLLATTATDPGVFVQERYQLRYELDLNAWNLRIWGVAASGFLTDSFVRRLPCLPTLSLYPSPHLPIPVGAGY